MEAWFSVREGLQTDQLEERCRHVRGYHWGNVVAAAHMTREHLHDARRALGLIVLRPNSHHSHD
jgi:hypothetical protein